MRYEYANEKGDKVIIQQRMSDEHPAAIQLRDGVEFVSFVGLPSHLRNNEWRPCDPSEPGAFVRVFGNFVPCTPDKSFGTGSAALPKTICKKLCPDRDGRGRPIVRNYAHAREIERATGFMLE